MILYIQVGDKVRKLIGTGGRVGFSTYVVDSIEDNNAKIHTSEEFPGEKGSRKKNLLQFAIPPETVPLDTLVKWDTI